MYALMVLPNSLAHMCSRITSIFISLSQGGQTGEYPKTEKMLSEKCTIDIKIQSNCDQMFLSFVYFGVCPKLFLCATLWKVCNWLLTAGNQSQCSFLSKRRESKLVQLSLIISPSGRLRDFLLAFFYF